MNFLMRRSDNQSATQEQQPVTETKAEPSFSSQKGGDYLGENGNMAGITGKSNYQVDGHIDVTEDDGLIIIPYGEIPDDWEGAPHISSYRSLDRNFVFAGEQIQLLVCLSAHKHNTGITAPVKDRIGQGPSTQNGKVVGGTNPVSQAKDANTDEQSDQNGDAEGNIDSKKDVSTSESFLTMEDHRRKIDQMLQIFKNSHFFARITESNEPLWSERSAHEAYVKSSKTSEEKLTGYSLETAKNLKKKNGMSVMIDRGNFDSPTSGGVARGAAKCCSLSNGDIVVLLEVKVGVEFMRDPVLEILQFEKNHKRNPTLEKQKILNSLNLDPYGELLNWLLPLTNSRRSSSHSLSPTLNSSSGVHSTSSKSTLFESSGSERLSFGRVKSYSMSSLSPYMKPPKAVTTPSAKPSFVPEDQNQFSFKNLVESSESGNYRALSFRGVSYVPGSFSVQCGLQGIFTPGRRWRRKFELIQLLEIHSFSVDCNTDDLLCVHVKNVSPANAPDVMVFIDSVTIVFEEALKSGPPLSLPIACTEAGNGYSLPNLALRRGEEHSFILKPATALWKHSKGQTDSNFPPHCLSARTSRSSWHCSSDTESRHGEPPTAQYAVLVSCRCNYTESKLFFRHLTSWRPRIARDLMVSVASETSRQTLATDGTQLPVQVLTLQVSNMTSDDLTLTVLAKSPSTAHSPVSLSPLGAMIHGVTSLSLHPGQNLEDGPPSASIHDQPMPSCNVICTHSWLQGRVPLGCVLSQSTVTIKLELLPLTEGIITLDPLQIDVKEKGLTYMPKHALKINATRALPLL